MQKYFAKRIIWLCILLLVLFLAWQAIAEAGYLIAYFQEGADPGSALNIVPNVPLDIHVGMQWMADDPDTGRVMDAFTRIEIQDAYLRAWLQWNLSLIKEEPYGLETYFVGPALADLDETLNGTVKKGWHVEQVDTNHVLQLHVYAADGSIVAFSDRGNNVEQVIFNKQGTIIYTGESASTYDIVMILQDGNWRIRHLVRTGDITQHNVQQASGLHTPSGFVGKRGSGLVLNGQPFHIAGINYYPQATPWDKFWLKYQPEVIEHDFALIHKLGMNTIRIFIPFTQFGGPDVGNPGAALDSAETGSSAKGPALVPDPIGELSDLLQRASAHQLHVIVTLFDFRSDYTLLHWPDADRQMQTLMTNFKDEPTILAWDLKNEPDQDWHSAGMTMVNIWLAHIAHLARAYDDHHLLTVGWSTPVAAQTQIAGLDFVSFHYYAPAEQLQVAYKAIQAANPGLPVAMTEFGLPTWNSPFFPNGHTEAEQAEYYANLLLALRHTNSIGYIAWTLYDFTYAPASVAGGLPWQSAPQKQLGIIRANGLLKPAASLLAPTARLNRPPLPFWDSLLKPFWLTLSAGLLTLMVLIVTNINHRHSLWRRT